MPRRPRPVGSVVVATVALGSIGAGAHAGSASEAIGPNQAFVGSVNGQLTSARINVVCPGPGGTSTVTFTNADLRARGAPGRSRPIC